MQMTNLYLFSVKFLFKQQKKCNGSTWVNHKNNFLTIKNNKFESSLKLDYLNIKNIKHSF